MTPDKNIVPELKGISEYLAGLNRQLPYAVPVGYFEQLPAIILEMAKKSEDPQLELAGLSPLLSGLSKKSPFSTPEGYFDQVPDEVNAGVSAIEQTREVLESLHPLLEGVRKVNPYKVPDNYFEELPAIIAGKRPKEAKLVQFGRKWFTYAAAAAIIGLVALAGWLYQLSAGKVPADTGALAFRLEQEINQLPDAAIFDYGDSAESLFNGSTANSDDDLNDSDMHILLEEVSDGALQQYLKDQPGKANPFNN